MDDLIKAINFVLKRIEEYNLESINLEKFTDKLETMVGKFPELKRVSKDDIEWLRVYELLLKKKELRDKNENYVLAGQEWRDVKAAFEKIKASIDDLEMYGIFTQVIWYIGGGCHFEILDSTKLLEYLYEKIIQVINKVEFKTAETVELPEQKIIPHTPDIIEDKSFFRTNLKRIHNELKDTVEFLSDIVSQSDIEAWIQQFDEDEEQKLCLKLLKNIRYYNQKDIRNLSKTLHAKLQLKLNLENLNKLIFVPVGESGKSGQMFGYLYRISNNISETKMHYYNKLPDPKDYDTIIFIDDFLATGSQFLDFFREKSKLAKLKNIKFYYLPLIGFKQGIERIEKESNVNVITGHKLTNEDLPLSKECTIFAKEEKEALKKTLESYGEKLYKNNSLGYENFGANVAFEHRVPNDTFSVVWSGAKGWFPIFKRYM